jgi:hypothetical protein
MGIGMFDGERMIGAVSDGRDQLPPDVRSRAFIAYTGKYHFDGTMLVTTVDGASSPDVEKEQIRYVRFESPTRVCITPKNTVLGHTAGLKVVWERVG